MIRGIMTEKLETEGKTQEKKFITSLYPGGGNQVLSHGDHGGAGDRQTEAGGRKLWVGRLTRARESDLKLSQHCPVAVAVGSDLGK